MDYLKSVLATIVGLSMFAIGVAIFNLLPEPWNVVALVVYALLLLLSITFPDEKAENE